MNDMISRQAAIDAVHKNYDTILDFKSDGRTVAGSFEDIINALPSVAKCFVAEDILKWLSGYYIRSLKLMGRYTPSEVITWVINDMTKTLFNEGEQDG